MEECPLCNLDKKKDEIIHYIDEKIIIVDTKNKKGHKNRIMVVWREHKKDISKDDEEYAMKKLIEYGKKIFGSYTKYFEIYEDKYSSIMNHWHRIAADIDPNSDDFEQVLNTPRYVIKCEDGKIIKYIKE